MEKKSVRGRPAERNTDFVKQKQSKFSNISEKFMYSFGGHLLTETWTVGHMNGGYYQIFQLWRYPFFFVMTLMANRIKNNSTRHAVPS